MKLYSHEEGGTLTELRLPHGAEETNMVTKSSRAKNCALLLVTMTTQHSPARHGLRHGRRGFRVNRRFRREA